MSHIQFYVTIEYAHDTKLWSTKVGELALPTTKTEWKHRDQPLTQLQAIIATIFESSTMREYLRSRLAPNDQT